MQYLELVFFTVENLGKSWNLPSNETYYSRLVDCMKGWIITLLLSQVLFFQACAQYRWAPYSLTLPHAIFFHAMILYSAPSPHHTQLPAVISVHPLRLPLVSHSSHSVSPGCVSCAFHIGSHSLLCMSLLSFTLLCNWWVTCLLSVLDCELLSSRFSIKTRILTETSAHCLAHIFSNVYAKL